MASPRPGSEPRLEWSSDAFDLDDMIVFVNSGPADGASKRAHNPPPKPLACARCHSQKLRCVRQRRHGRACDRCIAANADCVERTPQRMGRPADSHSRSRSPNANALAHPGRRDPDRHHHQQQQQQQQQQSRPASCRRPPHPHRRHGSTVYVSEPAPTLVTDSVQDESDGTAASFGATPVSAELADQMHWAWQSPAADHGNSTGHSPNEEVVVTNEAFTSAPAYSTTYAGPLIAGIGGLNSLLPNFDDVSTDLFPIECRPKESESESSLTAVQTPGIGTHIQVPDDYVEQLTKLHLELYRCLSAVRSIDNAKQEKPPPPPTGNEIDTAWLESVFQIAESFIATLDAYSRAREREQQAPASMLEDGHQAEAAGARNSPRPGNTQSCPRNAALSTELDTATGLTIVSCYSRLLQVLDVIGVMASSYRHNDNCPGNIVQVRFGSFSPTPNKSLHTRFVSQYILHLLESASCAASAAVAAKPLLARALDDIHGLEARIRETVLAAIR